MPGLRIDLEAGKVGGRAMRPPAPLFFSRTEVFAEVGDDRRCGSIATTLSRHCAQPHGLARTGITLPLDCIALSPG